MSTKYGSVPLEPEQEAKHAADEHHSWYALGLWQVPRLIRGEDVQEVVQIEREMTWSELFYDLIFVTAVAKMGEELQSGGCSVGQYILMFLTVFGFWMSSTEYGTRFHSDDMSGKIYFALHMIGMVGVTMNVPGSIGGNTTDLWALATCAMFIRLLETLCMLRIANHFTQNPTEKALSTGVNKPANFGIGNAAQFFVAAMFWLLLATSCLSPDWRAFILFADILLSKFAMFVALMRRFVVEPAYPAAIPHMMFLGKCDFSQSFLPFHLEHYTERLGLIMIIMLGESIDGIAVNNEHQRGSTKMYAAVFLAFLLVLSSKWLYFDCNLVNINSHAMRVSPKRGASWNLGHCVLACSIALNGDALAMIVTQQTGEKLEEEPQCDPRTLLCVSVGVTQVFLALLGHLHDNQNIVGDDDRSICFQRIERMQIAAQLLMGALAFYLSTLDEQVLPDLWLLALVSSSCLAIVVCNLVDEVVEGRWPAHHRGEATGGFHAPLMVDPPKPSTDGAGELDTDAESQNKQLQMTLRDRDKAQLTERNKQLQQSIAEVAILTEHNKRLQARVDAFEAAAKTVKSEYGPDY